MQIPILSGIYADGISPDLRASFPVNLMPVPVQSGISSGYLRPAEGIVKMTDGIGLDRGGIAWNGVCYRVSGTKLVSVSAGGAASVIGDVGGSEIEPVTFDYSFDRLAIASGGNLFYLKDGVLSKATDVDIGNVLDVVWVDGYFMTTDGTSLVVTELNDPAAVNPLKYGSSEADPDRVVAILKLRNEVYALNRHTIEVFDNVGGDFFPFQRIEGAQMQKGAVGTHACCVFENGIAFIGSGRNEPPGIYVGANASTQKISTHEIDVLLSGYGDSLSSSVLEARASGAHRLLYVHLPDRTMVFDAEASKSLGLPVWFCLSSGINGFSPYRAKGMAWAYGKWIVGDPETGDIGYLSDFTGEHWGNVSRWEFGTAIIYNEGAGAIFNSIELVAINGRAEAGVQSAIGTSYSNDGVSWSQEKSISSGKNGDTSKRLLWLRQGHMKNWRIQRFKGDSKSRLSFLRLEAQIEPLAR